MAGGSIAPTGEGVELNALRLVRGEKIVAVVPENCAGGGWSNSVVWVHISDCLGNIRTECLQPDEQTAEMRTLFDAGAIMHRALVGAVAVESAE